MVKLAVVGFAGLVFAAILVGALFIFTLGILEFSPGGSSECWYRDPDRVVVYDASYGRAKKYVAVNEWRQVC